MPGQAGKVQQELRELITQRVMAIALGYEDANDAARLVCDPIHKLLVGRDPVDGEDLAPQPTLSRFENAPNRKELLRMTEVLAGRVIERHRKRRHGRARGVAVSIAREHIALFLQHVESVFPFRLPLPLLAGRHTLKKSLAGQCKTGRLRALRRLSHVKHEVSLERVLPG
jgi:hypothetical protein